MYFNNLNHLLLMLLLAGLVVFPRNSRINVDLGHYDVRGLCFWLETFHCTVSSHSPQWFSCDIGPLFTWWLASMLISTFNCRMSIVNGHNLCYQQLPYPVYRISLSSKVESQWLPKCNRTIVPSLRFKYRVHSLSLSEGPNSMSARIPGRVRSILVLWTVQPINCTKDVTTNVDLIRWRTKPVECAGKNANLR